MVCVVGGLEKMLKQFQEVSGWGLRVASKALEPCLRKVQKGKWVGGVS